MKNNLLELEKNESLNKLKLQKKINKLLEIEIKNIQERISGVKTRNDRNDYIKIDNGSDHNFNILEELENKSNDSDEIRIIKKMPSKPLIASYNDKRNAIKEEKTRLSRSFQSQHKLEVAQSTPHQSPKLNNYTQLSKQRSLVRESKFKEMRDRNKSATTLIKSKDFGTINDSPKVVQSQKMIKPPVEKIVKQVEKPYIPPGRFSNIEKPSKLVSINVSNTNSNNVLKVYDKNLIDITNQNTHSNHSSNFHFQEHVNKNNNIFSVFDIKEDYLMSLAGNEHDTRNSFVPMFDSKFSVDMDYSQSLIKPRISSISKPPTIIDSNIKRSGGI